jgi:hypothetical protein
MAHRDPRASGKPFKNGKKLGVHARNSLTLPSGCPHDGSEKSGGIAMRHWILFSIGFVLLTPNFASAETKLGFCSLNGVTVSSDVTVRFNGVGAGAADQLSDSDILVVAPDGPTAGTANAAAVIFPAGGGGPKDKVDGAMKSFFEFGVPIGSVAQDTLLFEASGVASTENAINSAGNPAGAEVTGEARAEFFIDIVAGRDCDTFLNLQELRLLEPFETFLEINVIRDPGGAGQLLATLVPGSPAQTVLLPENNAFLIQLNYDYSLPNGIDPPFDLSYSITLGEAPAVPGLGGEAAIALSLLLLGVGSVFLHRRRATAQ